MIFQHIEKLQQQYTDKYVVVDKKRPNLRRFEGIIGRVKTVNMSGRALVQFEGINNAGWFDIEVDYLKVVKKPAPKETPIVKTAAKKKPPVDATHGSEPSALEKARASNGKKTTAGMSKDDAPDRKASLEAKPQKAAPPKMSVAEMLAAARSEKSAEAPAPERKETPNVQEKKPEPKKMSVAEMLAAARGEKSGDAAAAPTASASASTSDKEATPAVNPKSDVPKKDTPKKMSTADILAEARGKLASSQPAEATEPKAAATATATAEPAGQQPQQEQKTDSRLPTTTAEIAAYCREHDGK